MPPKKEEKIPMMLDRERLRKIAAPLVVQVIREREGGELGESVPLDDRGGRGYDYDAVETLESSGAIVRKAGGGTFRVVVSSESDPGSKMQWKCFFPGASMQPPETRQANTEAEMNSRAAEVQAAVARAQMPVIPPSIPWPGAGGPQPQPGQPPPAYPQPGMSGWPFMGGYPGMPYMGMPPFPQPGHTGDSAQIEAMRRENEVLRRQMDAESHRRDLEAERHRQKEDADRRDREIERKLEDERRQREIQHREMLEAIKGQSAKPAVDPAEMERRYREDSERRLAEERYRAEQARKEDNLRRDMDALRADGERKMAETQRQLTDAARSKDTEAVQTITQRMMDLQRESQKEMLALVKELNESRKSDPLDALIKMRQLTDNPTEKRFMEFALENAFGGGGGAADTAARITETLGATAERVVATIGEWKATQQAGRRGGGGARARFAEQRQQAQAPAPLKPAAPAQGLNGAATVPAQPANGHAPPAAPAAEQAPTDTTQVDGADDPIYFGVIWPQVKDLRSRADKQEVSGAQVLSWIVEGYFKLDHMNLLDSVPAMDDFEENPLIFVKRLLPNAGESWWNGLADAYPKAVEETAKKMDEAEKAKDGGEPGDDDGDDDGDDENAAADPSTPQ